MIISGEAVRRQQLEGLRPFIVDGREEFLGQAGHEHYRLLSYLSDFCSKRIVIDIGTHKGASAIALASNPEAIVLTFDVEQRTHPVIDERQNVLRHVADLTDPAVRDRYRRSLLESALILIDIDPHEGDREWALLEWLRAERYAGLILLDDIWHFKALREKVWYRLPRAEKVDLTPIGHWSGTGAVSFGVRPDFDEEPSRAALDAWTLVTGYFDLTGEPDATQEIQSRPPEHYLEEHASSTLALEHNLVVFTEPRFEESVWAKRPEHLRNRTRVYTQSFADFPLFKYREDIWTARQGYACRRDPRNTASYYLFCMARYAMLKQAIGKNEFASSHFAWINVCIERMGIRNVQLLDGALSCMRRGFSTCRIGFARPSIDDVGAFFGMGGCADANSSCGGCTFCSGFFTGDRQNMVEVCDLMEAEFVGCLCLEQGYGHADEQLMALVHARRPELFRWYVGDYSQMITNYDEVRENPEAPIANLILPAVAAGDWSTAVPAIERLWGSYVRGACTLEGQAFDRLLWAKREVRKHT